MLGPIFNREALTLPRRPQHYIGRVAYLGLLWIIGLTAWQLTVGWNQTATLYETSRFGPFLFRVCAWVQLVLLLFFSAVTAAGSVSQEKDRRTLILLLITHLKDYEIVLGKLLGSLLQIALFLAAVVPLLLFFAFLGGVAPYQVFQTVLILAATALAAGSLGTLMALWRDKTFQALALTVLALVLYLCVVQGLPLLLGVFGPEAWETVGYYQQWFHPFLALDSVQQPPHEADPPLAPAHGYALVMVAFSVLLNGWSILRLRVWYPSGEAIIQREYPEGEEADRGPLAPRAVPARGASGPLSGADLEDPKKREAERRVHAAPGAVREVAENPILWREISTRAYGRRPLLVKLGYLIVVGLICYWALAPLFGPGRPPAFAAAYALVPVSILSLLLIAAQAATAITTERDLGALDLLLVTDLSPREFIFGKLGGILYNTKEYVLPPLILTGVYAWFGWLATPPAGHTELGTPMNFEAFACLVGGALVMIAFTIVLGLHVALRTPNSRLAILNTLSTIFFLSVGTLVCVALILIGGRFEYQWTSFLVFVIAGVGGLMWVLNGSRPSGALVLASWFCPFAVLYCVVNVLVGRPGTPESADPLLPFLVILFSFGFTVAAMLTPLLSEFDVALGRTTAGE